MSASPSHITQLLVQAGEGDSRAAGELLPLVYEELRSLARARLAHEPAGAAQTLQPTALVHEAYLRLVGDAGVEWNGRAHFFGAAALAMRRILVERARRRAAAKHGGGRRRVDLGDGACLDEPPSGELLAIDEVLTRLERYDAGLAELVMLRYFAGLTLEQIALAQNVGLSRVKGQWAYARAWLHRELGNSEAETGRESP